jgi:hypothetical protein
MTAKTLGPGTMDLGVSERHQAVIRLGVFILELSAWLVIKGSEVMGRRLQVVGRQGESGRLGAGRPRPKVVQETIHGKTIEVNEVLIRLVAEGEPLGGLSEALREDQEEVQEGLGEDLEIRREVLGPLVACQVVTVVRIGSWMCWRQSPGSRGSRLSISDTSVMETVRLGSRSAATFPKLRLRVARL